MNYRFIKISFLLSFLIGAILWAGSISGVSLVTNAYQKMNNNIAVELIPNGDRHRIYRVVLRYRPQGAVDFEQKEMEFDGYKYYLELDKNKLPGRIFEYEFAVTDRYGQTSMYSASEMGDLPFRYTMQDDDQSENLSEREKVDAIVISPMPGETVNENDFLVVVSILNLPPNFDVMKTKFYVDGVDYSRDGNIGERVLTFAPTGLNTGEHKLEVQFFNSGGKPLNKLSWDFTLLSAKDYNEGSTFSLNGRAYINNRYEALQQGTPSAVSNNYTRGGVDLNARMGFIDFGGQLFVSSEESERLQPVNKYRAYLRLNWGTRSFAYVSAIDNFPYYNKYVLKDTRIRGVAGTLQFGYLELSGAYGSSQRGISALTRPSYVDSTITETYGYAYDRKDMAARIAIGSKSGFLFGLSAYKSKDDENSFSIEGGKQAGVNYAIGGIKPMENVVAGADFSLKLDDQRIVLFGNAAASVVNKDIQNGSVPYDTLMKYNPDMVENIDRNKYDLITKIITFNGGIVANPGIAFDAGIKLHYFNNFFQAKYESTNPEFRSFGLQYVRNDYDAIRISDAFSIMQNQLMFNVGYNMLRFNKSTVDKINSQQLNVMVSYNPDPSLPTISVNYTSIKRSSDSPTAPLDESYNSFNFNAGYIMNVFGIKNHLQAIYTKSQRDDPHNISARSDYDFISLWWKTYFDFPLQARIGFQKNLNDVGVDTLGYNSNNTAFLLGADYSLGLLSSWELKLGVFAQLGNFTQESFFTGNTNATKNLYRGYVSLDLGHLGLLYSGVDYNTYNDGSIDFNTMYWITRYSINF